MPRLPLKWYWGWKRGYTARFASGAIETPPYIYCCKKFTNIPIQLLRLGLDDAHGQEAADTFEVGFERIAEINSV